MKAAWIALWVIVACGTAGALDPPSPAPAKAGQINQNGTEHIDAHSKPSDKLSESAAPLANLEINGQINQTQATDHSANGEDESFGKSLEKFWSIFLVPALTVFLIGAQVVIYWKQRDLMATQAKIMGDSLTLQQPIVYGRVSKPGLKGINTPRGPDLNRGILELCIYNIGTTPANLTRLEWGIFSAPHGEIPLPIDPTIIGGRELPVGTVAIKSEPFLESEKLALRFIEEQNEIVEFKRTVWVIGFVRYGDIFDKNRISGFAHALDLIHERFVRRGGERYNYARDEDPKDIPPKSS